MIRRADPKPATTRCAIYTRKSTEEGLEQEFNSLDAQREAAEAYIASQKHEGWTCVPDRYDDGGFSGGTMERPALRRLLIDVEAGRVDCIVVYKVDRLSRSLLDFARIMAVLDDRGVSFVSVTQQFNTTSSMGRLTLNILLSFALSLLKTTSLLTSLRLASVPDRLFIMLLALVHALISALQSQRALAVENLALRHQLLVLQRTAKKPRLRREDRILWMLLSRFWTNWREVLTIVQPETVIRWHREGFRLYWRLKSRSKASGRPRIDKEVRDLVRQMSEVNVLWGAPRIHGELLKLGIEISQATVSKYMARHREPPSQDWRTFLENHAREIVSIDFFTVPTAAFRVLFVFLILSNQRRRIIHFNVTTNPSAAWTGQQIAEAFPWDTAPRYLVRDRDGIYGSDFVRRVEGMGVEETLISARSPWQNPYVERVIGSIRRECLDHVIIFSERHLRRVLRDYLEYYHGSRTHLGLGKDCPVPRSIQPPALGMISSEPMVGGLHHRYFRRAA